MDIAGEFIKRLKPLSPGLVLLSLTLLQRGLSIWSLQIPIVVTGFCEGPDCHDGVCTGPACVSNGCSGPGCDHGICKVPSLCIPLACMG